MAGRECYHCKQRIEEGEPHDCWTTTEAALTRDLSEDLQEAWERLRETAVGFGDQRVYASHQSIMFSRRSCYFFVRPKRNFLEVCVFLGRSLKAPQVRRVVHASKSKRVHIIHIRHRDEVEAPITTWLQEAYGLSDVVAARVDPEAAEIDAEATIDQAQGEGCTEASGFKEMNKMASTQDVTIMNRATFICGSTLLALSTALLWGCASQPPGTDTQAASADAAQPAAHPEQALLEDLALANRILAREAAILDAQGHVTARSLVNPNHYYIARYLSPGGVTASDFIENDLDSMPVHGARNDQAREIYLHGEIFKARPDVMAVVHAHTPEFVAFGMSSVPLWNGGSAAPVWDIRQFNKGRSGIVNTPELGRAMAETLGRTEGVLLWGHGIAMTGSSIKDAVTRVIELRDSAQLQQAAISMGNAWKPQAATHDPVSRDRTWEYLKREVTEDTGGRVPPSAPRDPAKPSDPIEAAKRDLVLANRILASEELSILDMFGHVSVRNPSDASAYFIAPGVPAAAVKTADIVQRNTSAPAADSQGLSIHDEVYKARPEVRAVLYARTPEIVAFTHGSMTLRPIVNGGAFLADALPVLNMSTLDPQQPVLANPALGPAVANALGKSSAVLLSGHGFVLTAASIYNLVDRAHALRLNARIQRQALALRGRVTYLNERPVPPAPANAPGAGNPLGPPEGRAWIYWSKNVTVE